MTYHRMTAPVEHVRVNLGRRHIFVTERFLDGQEVPSRFKQMGGKRVLSVRALMGLSIPANRAPRFSARERTTSSPWSRRSASSRGSMLRLSDGNTNCNARIAIGIVVFTGQGVWKPS